MVNLGIRFASLFPLPRKFVSHVFRLVCIENAQCPKFLYLFLAFPDANVQTAMQSIVRYPCADHLEGLHVRNCRAGNRQLAVVEAHYPTLPSKLTPSSFCASTANSIGSSRNTSLQKPLTIMFTASSADRPRCLQ